MLLAVFVFGKLILTTDMDTGKEHREKPGYLASAELLQRAVLAAGVIITYLASEVLANERGSD